MVLEIDAENKAIKHTYVDNAPGKRRNGSEREKHILFKRGGNRLPIEQVVKTDKKGEKVLWVYSLFLHFLYLQ